MEEFEVAPAAKETDLGSRLASLEKSVEGKIDDLFMAWEPPESSKAKLAELKRTDREKENEQQESNLEAENESLTSQVETGARTVARLDENISDIEPVAQLLDTTDLPQLTDEQAHQIETVLAASPQITPTKHVIVETATVLGFNDLNIKELAPIADELGHPFIIKGQIDFKKLRNPDEQFFIAALSALVNEYDHSDLVFPESRFVDLPRSEMTSLHQFFLEVLQKNHPHLKADSQYKLTELRKVAEKVLQKANKARQVLGTDMFGKIPRKDFLRELTTHVAKL